jgi:hypothetical protein
VPAADLDCEHDANVTKADLGDQAIEAAACDPRAADPEIVIDDEDLVASPAHLDRAFHQSVLPTLALQVLDDLGEGGLANVDGRLPRQVYRRDLGAHDLPLLPSSQRPSRRASRVRTSLRTSSGRDSQISSSPPAWDPGSSRRS